jgi:hypothetical protein
VERWWNNQWGRLARLDLWLKSDGQHWRVEARRGDGDARVWGKDFGRDEAGARALVAQMKARGADNWISLSGHQPPKAEQDVCPACDAPPGALHIELRPPPRKQIDWQSMANGSPYPPIPWLLCQVCGLTAPGKLTGGAVIFDLSQATQTKPSTTSTANMRGAATG